MKRPALRGLVFLPGELLGLAVPFLPFEGFVPVHMVARGPGTWIGVQQLVLVPLVLGTAMAASTVRQAVAGPLSRAKRIVAYALAFHVLLVSAGVVLDSRLGPVVGPTFLLAAVGAIVVLAATMKGRVPPHVHAHVALLAAWVVNVGLSVIVTFAESPRVGTGCWVAAASVVMVAVEAVLRVRASLRRGPEDETAGEPA